MAKFALGDRVYLNGWTGYTFDEIGMTGTVVEIDEDDVLSIKWDTEFRSWHYHVDDVTKIVTNQQKAEI